MRLPIFTLATALLLEFSLSVSSQILYQTTALEQSVNSSYDELAPIISPDGNTLYFTRKNHPENTFFRKNSTNSDIWYTERSNDGNWKEAVHMPAPFNKRVQNSIESISPDGNIIYIRGAYNNGKFIGNGISRSYRTEAGWSSPQKMNIKRFKKMNRGTTTNFFVTPDGKRLLLSFSRVDKSKVNDLYFCFLKTDSTWSRPRRLNFPVNGRQSTEQSPYMAADGETLYFSSDREGGHGKNDIYLTRRTNKNWTKWTEPIPLDSPINTANWEAYYTVDAKGESAYFVSTQTEGKLTNSDIVKVHLKEEFRPNPVSLYNGRILEYKSGKPVTASIRFFDATTNTEVATTRSEPESGTFKMTLPLGKMYFITAKAEGYLPISEYVDLQNTYAYTELHEDLTAVPFSQIKGISPDLERQAEVFKNAKLDYFQLDSNLLELKLANGNKYDLLPTNDYYTAVLRSTDPMENSLSKALEGKSLAIIPSDMLAFFSEAERADINRQGLLQSDMLGEDSLSITLPSRKHLMMLATGEENQLKTDECSKDLVAMVNESTFDKINYIPLNEINGLSNVEKLQLLNKALILPSESSDGSYELTLLDGKKFSLTPTLDGYNALALDEVKVDREEDWSLVDKVEEQQQVQVGNTVRIDNLFFDFGTHTIRPESYPALDKLVRIMNDNPNMEIFIKGHSDDIGSANANLIMSMRRAESVRNYLTEHKIHPYRILFQGYGSMMPLLADGSDKARQLNRRVEFTVLR